MMTLNEVRAAMADRNLSEVSRRSGVSYYTLLRLASGRNVRYESIKALSDYFTRKEVA